MIYIDMEMPECCCDCPINFWNNCGLIRFHHAIGGRIENPDDERLPDCPLKTTPTIDKDILMKMAIAIKEKCGDGSCPCKNGCNVYSNEDCIDRIINWLKSAIEK